MGQEQLVVLTAGLLVGSWLLHDFRILAAESGWNQPALSSFFKTGLSDSLRDELVCLEELITLVIQLDNQFRERQRARASTSRGPATITPSQISPQSPPYPSWMPRAPPADLEESMQVNVIMWPLKNVNIAWCIDYVSTVTSPDTPLPPARQCEKGPARQWERAHWWARLPHFLLSCTHKSSCIAPIVTWVSSILCFWGFQPKFANILTV